MVSLVAWAALRSRSTLPVCTDWLVTRNPSTSPSVCACAGAAHASIAAASAAPACVLIVIAFLRYMNDGRANRPVRLDIALAVDVVSVFQIAAFRVVEDGVAVDG